MTSLESLVNDRARRWMRRAVPFLLAGVVAAACSGGGSDTASGTSGPTVSTAPTTTVVETTTSTTTSTTEPAPLLAPLTGEPVAAPIERPALMVKIDANPRARPQWGLNQADIVYEEIVESQVTRFAAVFQSEDSDPVGPVRSARTSDFALLAPLNTPLFANSGGNANVLNAIDGLDVVSVNHASAAGNLYFREGSRSAPHNLLTNTSELYAAADGEGGVPAQQFTYRQEGEALPVDARPVQGVDLAYGGTNASYRWDPVEEGWLRTENGDPHVDIDGVQIAPENVVVQFVEYGRSPADQRSPEAITVGEGEAWVLTDGHIVQGRWQRPTAEEPLVITTNDGTVVGLTPGKTWVALPRVGQGTVVG
jgi:Protein of unknown function (DUF3048) N-terminal domain/Protein of unknown function (DUF3048) C-terminal domain